MTQKITCKKAIIAVAGFGTRRLPITKAIEKCMIPVGNRPVVDYIVQDCIKAGITDIIFVVGEQSDQVRTYYGHNDMLEAYLERHSKQAALEETRKLATEAQFKFIIQDRHQPYGTSTPVWLSRDLVGNDPFIFLYGDNIFYKTDGSSAIADFLAKAAAADAQAAMMAVEVAPELVEHYGIIDFEKQGDVELFRKIVEKPKPENAPSNLNNAGCFLMTPAIMPYVEESMLHSPQEERYFIDAINSYASAGNHVAVVRTDSEYLDCGTAEGWLHANNRIMSYA
jgi:UTP--glucose-1-phosphate uridylyltransferase